jgi:hypothetical protein
VNILKKVSLFSGTTIKDSADKTHNIKNKTDITDSVKQQKSNKKVTSLTNNKKVDNIKNTAIENVWKSFDDSRPQIDVPCEFYVDYGKDKKEIVYGYLTRDGSICTDNPYTIIVLRKRFNNLFYHEISECESVINCPNGFPDCKKCKRGKK